jgi:excisionase family DNA binding protein
MFEQRVAQLNGIVKAKRTYTVSEVCDILAVGRVSVYHLIKQGAFQAVLVDNKYRIIKSSFDQWLDQGNEQGV